MCGVIGLRCEKDRGDLGAVAARLLRMLEYRGYDSTGAAIQDSAGRVVLRKDVGSPTAVTKRLGIGELSGKIFCGQVRWATFGGVTKENAQPHEARCKTHLYGAHNGNITNCDQLKVWLTRQGHRVLSDNDGEMLVHTVEHFFALELSKRGLKTSAGRGAGNPAQRQAALKAAILEAARRMVGSYAAVVVDPVTHLVAAVKAGSSLYMGVGHDEAHGPFTIASSDLASVLSMTKILLPIMEDEFAFYTHDSARFYHLRTGRELAKKPVRSRLRVEETELAEPFRFFMQQEIFSQPAAVAKVIGLFLRRSDLLALAERLAGRHPSSARAAVKAVGLLASRTHADRLKADFLRFLEGPEAGRLKTMAAHAGAALKGEGFESSMGGFLDELSALAPKGSLPVVRLLDGFCLLEEADDIARRCGAFAALLARARRSGRAVYMLACGTSFHAAKCASVFFNKIAGVRVTAMLPGDFRAECAGSLQDGDLVIGISQSGETKDLIDVVNLVRASRLKVSVVTVVNNVNSTLALEKTDLYLPLFCGPEIAVPATKSFMNQLAVLYILALKTAEKTRPGGETARRRDNLLKVPTLLEETAASIREPLDQAARDLFMEPSIHILATGMQGVAKEGALKVREVVLNHTEGYEGAEFKHGPNTILGVNTVFGLEAVRSLLGRFGRFSEELARDRSLSARSLARLYKAVADYAFDDVAPAGLDAAERRAFSAVFERHDFFESLYTNYPLVFVTGPSERDVNLTISQINTHKIRGADITIIAEESPALRDAVGRPQPDRFGRKFRSTYIRLPRTDDDLLPFFTSTLALQLLALHMSAAKLTLLDKLEIADHGVHPDSPKNVSKSITVD
ncbi:MAG: SIS domain-containing protein [Elusimicrobiota bacterium]|jgi:glucosamine 6-phosphate synthetase-like amidotransferase/phosphosugar isomerase protein